MMVINSALTYYFSKEKHIAPLATFRVAFGVMMFFSIIRFWNNGWIKTQYINPQYYFTYFGFDWVKPLGEPGMYILFSIMAMAALGIALGIYYRLSATIFFLSFTYVELIDKTNYLNHYYFVSLIAFLLIIVPANRLWSIDAYRKPDIKNAKIPAWSIDIFILQLTLVYFFAGLAKLHSEWLLEALPLKIWLPSRAHTPFIGWLLDYQWTAYVFSWFGALYDLSIPFFLLWPRTRLWAYITVIVFHGMTAALFQIGMFPFIMILSTLIFFTADFHQKLWAIFGFYSPNVENTKQIHSRSKASLWLRSSLILYLAIQVLLPFRYLLYPGKLFWTEQGYRFSWRVMLMEKVGYSEFYIVIPEKQLTFAVFPAEHLSPVQEKMMNTQPDMILQFAHYLRDMYQEKHQSQVEVYVDSYAAINGKGSRPFIDPHVNLAQEKRGWQHKNWILDYE